MYKSRVTSSRSFCKMAFSFSSAPILCRKVALAVDELEDVELVEEDVSEELESSLVSGLPVPMFGSGAFC